MNPSLTQVLAGSASSASAVHLNPFFLAIGLAACLAATISLAWRRRGRSLSAVVGPSPVSADRGQEEKLEKLNFMIDQLKINNQQLALQNTELSGQVQGVNGCLNDLKQTRDVLEKSNLVLSKECEKLRAQKEELVLKASVPLVKAKGRARPAALKINNKGVGRKPGRVSRKTK